MPIQFDTFSQEKIDTLKSHLEASAAKGKPKSFEIWVDGLQVIPRTEEPSDFDSYEAHLTADSRQIKVVIYCTDKTNRNDKYIYSLKAKSTQEAIDQGIAGLPVKTFNSREIDQWRQKQNLKSEQEKLIAALREELNGLHKELDEKQEYIVELEDEIQQARANRNKIGNFDVSYALGTGLELFLRNTTSIWGKHPALSGVAQAVDEDTKARASQSSHTEDTEVSFRKKDSPSQGIILTDQEKELLHFVKQIQRHFSPAELEQVIAILDLLSKDKSELAPVLGYLQNENEDEDEEGEEEDRGENYKPKPEQNN